MSKDNMGLAPKLRFPKFQDEWKQYFGNQLFDTINNKDHDSSLPVLAITQEHGAIPRDLIDYQVSVTEKSIESYKVVEIGDFIISLRSFQGGIEYSRYKGICSPAYIILRKNTDVSEAYFKYFFKTDRFIQQLQKNLEGLRDGKMVSYQQFSELLLPTPSTPEQQKIADCLTSLDELISAERGQLDTLNAYKKGLLQTLFPAEGEALPRLRFPEFQSDGEWETNEFSKYIVLYRGSSPRPIQEYFTKSDDGVNWIKIGDTKAADNYVINQVEEKITPEGAEKSRKVSSGELILANSMSFGKTYQLAIDGYIYDGWFVLREYEEYFHKQFLLQLLNSEYMQKQYIRLSAGGIVQNISSDIVYSTILPHTSIEEQQKIAELLTSLDEEIAGQGQRVAALQVHKQGLLQGLFPVPEKT